MGDYDPDGELYYFRWHPRRRAKPTCNRCGATNLTWSFNAGRWQLLNPDGTPHKCGGPVPLSTSNDFLEVRV